jgi:hypothetical protein
MPDIYLSFSVGFLFILSLGLMLVNDWRWMIGILCLQYLCVMFLIMESWPFEIAVIKIVAGWFAVALLSVSYVNMGDWTVTPHPVQLPNVLFRSLIAVLAALSISSFFSQALIWFIGATGEQVLGGLLLLGMGLIHLGFATHSTRIIISLLTVLSGFEILYATVEASVLMTALLAANHIGLAFLGAYVLNIPSLEVDE